MSEPRTSAPARALGGAPLAFALAGWVGASTLAYEVLWTRVLRYFVDTSIYSFAIILTAFLGGLALGGALVARRIDSRRDLLLVLGSLEVCIGVSSVLSIPGVAHMDQLATGLDVHVGTSWGASVVTRFLIFAAALLAPTALLGAAFPVLAKLGAGGAEGAPFGVTMGRLYGANTAGGVAGSVLGGFALLPWLGVQRSLVVVSALNVVVGLALVAVCGLGWGRKLGLTLGSAALFGAVVSALRPDALTSVYSQRYAHPNHELLYLGENVNGTTAVFRDVARRGATPGANARLYLVIDGRGEVSTDYFSMRAFRFLGLLPAFYAPKAEHALVVTFGSGIVAGSIAGLPEVKDAECVEICSEAFHAAHFFAAENHDVLANPKLHFVVNDGRNHLLTTRRTYDIISADATHPTSGDSWILYTKEFYELCATRLNDGGVMSQWIPMHGVREADFKTLLKTFHSAFPYVALYYAGGFKAAGHVVLVGSRSPLRIDVHRAERLFADDRVREDLANVNVLTLPDLFNGFLFDQSQIDAFAGDAPLNTDDRPVVAFSTPEVTTAPSSWLASIAKHRMSIYPALAGIKPEAAAGIADGLSASFEATTSAIEGQVLEAKEYAARSMLDLERPDAAPHGRLAQNLAMLTEVVAKYDRALQLNPRDAETTYLRSHAVAELRSLQAMVDHGRSL